MFDKKKYFKEYQQVNKENIFNHYGNMCSCCGETEMDFLVIDHIDNNGSEHRKKDKTAINIYQWIIRNKYPMGFQVLCANCNTSKGKRGQTTCIHNRKPYISNI